LLLAIRSTFLAAALTFLALRLAFRSAFLATTLPG
jgi:hypothetical protein